MNEGREGGERPLLAMDMANKRWGKKNIADVVKKN